MQIKDLAAELEKWKIKSQLLGDQIDDVEQKVSRTPLFALRDEYKHRPSLATLQLEKKYVEKDKAEQHVSSALGSVWEDGGGADALWGEVVPERGGPKRPRDLRAPEGDRRGQRRARGGCHARREGGTSHGERGVGGAGELT